MLVLPLEVRAAAVRGVLLHSEKLHGGVLLHGQNLHRNENSDTESNHFLHKVAMTLLDAFLIFHGALSNIRPEIR